MKRSRPAGGSRWAWWEWAGLSVAAVGVVGGIVLFGWGVLGTQRGGFQRVEVPGARTVRLEAGGYTMYHEFPDADRCYDDVEGCDRAPVLDGVTLRSSETRPPVEVRRYHGDESYMASHHDMVAVFTFSIEDSGAYTLAAAGDRSTVAVARDGSRWGLVAVAGGVVVGVGGVLAGAGVAQIGERASWRRATPIEPVT